MLSVRPRGSLFSPVFSNWKGIVHWRGYADHRNQGLLLGIGNHNRNAAVRNLWNPGPVHSKNGNEISRMLLYYSDHSSQREDACARVSPVQDPLRAEVEATATFWRAVVCGSGRGEVVGSASCPNSHVIICYSQSLSARRTVSTNVLFEPTTVFELAKFA
jgi:hypothetical protein